MKKPAVPRPIIKTLSQEDFDRMFRNALAFSFIPTLTGLWDAFVKRREQKMLQGEPKWLDFIEELKNQAYE